MSLSTTVDGGQHDTKYVTFDLLLHAAFVADEIWVIRFNQLVCMNTCTYRITRMIAHLP